MRRRVLAVTIMASLAAAWISSPSPGNASCAGTATLEQVAEVPGTAVFTGWVSGTVAGSQDLVFTVDHWFHGRHASREVRLLGSSAVLAEPQARGLVDVALAEVVAGDAIRLTRDEPVIMVAAWAAEARAFDMWYCSRAGLPLASPEGQAALEEANAVFGPGRVRAELPDTSTLAGPARDEAAPRSFLPEWSFLLFTLTLAAVLVVTSHRIGGRRQLP